MITLMLVWTVEFSCSLIWVRPHVLCCWLSWPFTLVMQSGRRKLAYIMIVAMCILHVKYVQCTVKHTQENVLKKVVNVTNGLGVSLAISYLAVRIMLHVGWCIGGNLNNYLSLN